MAGHGETIVKLELPLSEVRSLLETVRRSQQEARKVTSEFPTYEIHRAIDVRLEQIKMGMVRQLQAQGV